VPVNAYEGMFILDSNKHARNSSEIPGKLEALVAQLEGEMLVSRLWNEQKLAYPIKGHRKGVYWLTYFKLDSSKLAELDEQVKLTDGVLRSLVLKIDPRLVDALVAHASASGAAGAGEGQEDNEEKSQEDGDSKREKVEQA
jgi:small subunit ribosomal protein S6